MKVSSGVAAAGQGAARDSSVAGQAAFGQVILQLQVERVQYGGAQPGLPSTAPGVTENEVEIEKVAWK